MTHSRRVAQQSAKHKHKLSTERSLTEGWPRQVRLQSNNNNYCVIIENQETVIVQDARALYISGGAHGEGREAGGGRGIAPQGLPDVPRLNGCIGRREALRSGRGGGERSGGLAGGRGGRGGRSRDIILL